MSDPIPIAPPGAVSIARFLGSTRAEGPGERTAIWVQGCAIRCRGCFNPHMWSFRGGERIAVGDLVRRILATGTEGVTLLGGEPFDQAAALSEVARGVRRAGRSVMTFTGYTRAQLARATGTGRDDVAALLSETDLLVAGPFQAGRIDHTRPWAGSTNQEFVLLTNRFPNLLEDLDRTPDRVEVTVDAGGRVAVNGWAESDALDELLESLRPARRATLDEFGADTPENPGG